MDSVDRSNERWPACRADEVTPGQRKIIVVAGRQIGLFNCSGTYHAIANRCPHRGAPLCLGRIRPWVTGESPGDVRHPEEPTVIKCPWHQWEFELTSGRALADRRLRVATYRTVVEDGIVYVLVDPVVRTAAPKVHDH